MRKIFALVFLCLLVCGCGMSVGIGSGLGGQSSNVTGSVTALAEVRKIGLLLGGEVYYDFKGNLPSGVLDYKAPHTNYHSYKADSGEIGLSLLGGYKFNEWFGLLGGIGFALNNEHTIAVSNATGWKYDQDVRTRADIEFSAQALFKYKYFIGHAGYSFRRGLIASVGFMF